MIEYDHEINRQEVMIDELSLNIIALRQPAARDLRFITLALKVSTDLERIGDLCVNIAERTLELNQEPQLKPYIDLPAEHTAVAIDLLGTLHERIDEGVGDAVEHRAEHGLERAAGKRIAHVEFDAAGAGRSRERGG